MVVHAHVKYIIALIAALGIVRIVGPSETVAVDGTLAGGIVAGVYGEASIGARGRVVTGHVHIAEAVVSRSYEDREYVSGILRVPQIYR